MGAPVKAPGAGHGRGDAARDRRRSAGLETPQRLVAAQLPHDRGRARLELDGLVEKLQLRRRIAQRAADRAHSCPEIAVEIAAQKGAYTLWGLVPFLRLKEELPLDLQPMVLRDAALQRVMVSVVVNPKKVPGVNAAGATALTRYLLEPSTQSRIQEFRYPGVDAPVWWPAGRHNGSENR